VFATQEWRKIGIEAEHRPLERLVGEAQKIVLDNAYYLPGLWWRRSVVHWVKNYVAPPNHYSNQKLQDVWLSED
jgi:hypothetical protein